MKKILFVFLALSIALGAAAQDNFIFDMPDDFAQLDTVAHPAKFKSIHMIGVSYGVNWSGVTSSPGLGQEKKLTYNNIGVYFTYYHALWDQLFNFGLKFGVKHGYEGYLPPKNNYGETCEILEVPLISQFKLDFSRFRVLLNSRDIGRIERNETPVLQQHLDPAGRYLLVRRDIHGIHFAFLQQIAELREGILCIISVRQTGIDHGDDKDGE